MTAADPLPAGVIHAIVDCAYQLPPGTSAERWAALMDPEPGPEAEADDRDPWTAPPDYRPATQEEKEAFHEEMQRRCADSAIDPKHQADAYVTEVCWPDPDNGIQRLYSPMKAEPEAEAEI